NGDDSLGSKVRHHLDLLIGKRANFLAKDAEHAHKLIIFEHRHTEGRANPTEFDGSNNYRVPFSIGLGRCEVGYLSRLLGCKSLAQGSFGVGSKGSSRTCLGKGWRHTMGRSKANFILFT